MVRHGDGFLAHLLDVIHQRRNAREAVQQRVFGVKMKVSKHVAGTAIIRGGQRQTAAVLCYRSQELLCWVPHPTFSHLLACPEALEGEKELSLSRAVLSTDRP